VLRPKNWSLIKNRNQTSVATFESRLDGESFSAGGDRAGNVSDLCRADKRQRHPVFSALSAFVPRFAMTRAAAQVGTSSRPFPARQDAAQCPALHKC